MTAELFKSSVHEVSCPKNLTHNVIRILIRIQLKLLVKFLKDSAVSCILDQNSVNIIKLQSNQKNR